MPELHTANQPAVSLENDTHVEHTQPHDSKTRIKVKQPARSTFPQQDDCKTR